MQHPGKTTAFYARKVNDKSKKEFVITQGKAYGSEFAPTGWRFKTPFGTQDIFNNITRQHKSAREAKERFNWNSEFKFWFTQSVQSKDKAIKELNERGYTQRIK